MDSNKNRDLTAEEREWLREPSRFSTIRQVMIGKMEGATNTEIAARIGRSVATVERLVAAIRRVRRRESLR
jgi:transposase